MTIDAAVKSNIISLEDYNKIVEHIEEVNRIINKYDYMSRRCVSNWHSIKCKVTDIKQDLLSAEHSKE